VSDDSETYDTNVIFLNDQCQQLAKLQNKHEESSSENEFYDSTDKLHETLTVEVRNNNSCPDILTACRDINGSQQNLVDSLLYKKTNELRDILKDFVTKKENNISDRNNTRGGKYNKRTAPKPPCEQQKLPDRKDDISEGAVKGTLILKPGIIKSNIGCDVNKCKELFLETSRLRKRHKQYFTSSSIAFGACSRINLVTEPLAKRNLTRNSQKSLFSSPVASSLQSRSETNLNNMQLDVQNSESTKTPKTRLRLNFLRSKSFHMGNKSLLKKDEL
ncbi:hypothetical protein HHI36_011895, partial [Cryptolaemus montrouzieri]